MASCSTAVMVSEKWLCALWRRQRWRDGGLFRFRGQPLQVIYAGRHTFDHGPDFRDALLVFGNDLVRGDVEIHVSTGDWRAHGHYTDPRYDGVILHVVWRDDGVLVQTAAGKDIPALVLEEWVDETPDCVTEESQGQRMPCSNSRLHGYTGEARMALAAMGEARLVEKAAVFEAALAVDEPAQVIYAALLDALGYSRNRGACRELARTLPWHVVAACGVGLPLAARVAELEALFLGGAGLLPTQREVPRPMTESDAEYAAVLTSRWATLNPFWCIAPLARRDWHFGRVRPENFPPRRLAAAARLFAPYVAADLPAALLGVLRSEEPEDIPAALEDVLMVPPVGYWATHCDFGARPAQPAYLLGRARAADVAVNVILPFAMAFGALRGDTKLAERARTAYRCYPALADNEFTRYVGRFVFGHDHPRGITACQQQGLLHVYHRYCRDKRCGECPLAQPV